MLLFLFSQLFVLRHWIVAHDFAFINPNFYAASTISGMSRRGCIINVRTKCVQRHATFTIVFSSGDFSTAQTTATRNLDTLCTQTKSRLHNSFHSSTERNTTFQLLSHRVSNQLRIKLRFSNFNDVQLNFRISQFLNIFS